MIKKVHFIGVILIGLMFAASALAQTGGLVYHEAQIKDELNRRVTDITTVTIYGPGTTNPQTIFKDSARSLAITQPMTTSSTNTTLVDGQFFWYGPDGWDYTISDGTNTHTNGGHNSLNASNALVIFPSYLQSISSTQYSDAQTATWGTDGDWIQQGGNVANQLSFTPGADNSNFIIGTNGTALNSDFTVYVGVDLGLRLDAGVPSLTWDGGAVTLNENSNFSVGLATGTSTGAISIGNSAAGIITLDTTATLTLNSDGAMGITTTDGSADITVDATAGSVIVDGGEAVADAVTIAAGAGGVDISSAATFDIDITATGGRILLVATEAVANQFYVDAQGTVAGDAINFETSDGGIMLNADGGGNGDIELNAENDVIITAAGDMTLTTTGTLSLAGSQVTNRLSALETVTTQTNAVNASESGVIFDVVYTGTHTTTLPQAAPGLMFTIIDGSSTAGDDVIVDIQAGDNIEADTNGDGIQCVTDEEGSSITLIAITSTRWIVLSTTGTWAAQ